MSLLSRNTPYSKRYVSTLFEKRGKLYVKQLKRPIDAASQKGRDLLPRPNHGGDAVLDHATATHACHRIDEPMSCVGG